MPDGSPITRKVLLEVDLNTLQAMAEMTGLVSATQQKMSEADQEGYNRIRTQVSSLNDYEMATVKKRMLEVIDMRKKEAIEIEKFVRDRYEKEKQLAKEVGREWTAQEEARYQAQMKNLEEVRKKWEGIRTEPEKKDSVWTQDISKMGGVGDVVGGLKGAMAAVGKGFAAFTAALALTENTLSIMSGVETKGLLRSLFEAVKDYNKMSTAFTEAYKSITVSMWAGGSPYVGGAEGYGKEAKDTMLGLVEVMRDLKGLGISIEQTAKIMDTLSRRGLIDREDVGKIAMESVFLGMGRGMAPEVSSQYMAELSYRFRVPSTDLGRVFTEFSKPLTDAQGKTIMSGEEVMKQSLELAKGFRNLGYGTGDALQMVREFGGELRNGKMTMGDLNQMIRGMTEREEGINTFIAQRITQMSPNELKNRGLTGYAALMGAAKTPMEQAAFADLVDIAREMPSRKGELTQLLSARGIKGVTAEDIIDQQQQAQAAVLEGMRPAGVSDVEWKYMLRQKFGGALGIQDLSTRGATYEMYERMLGRGRVGDITSRGQLPESAEADRIKLYNAGLYLSKAVVQTDAQKLADLLHFTRQSNIAMQRLEKYGLISSLEGIQIPTGLEGAAAPKPFGDVWGVTELMSKRTADVVEDKTAEWILQMAAAQQPGGPLANMYVSSERIYIVSPQSLPNLKKPEYKTGGGRSERVRTGPAG